MDGTCARRPRRLPLLLGCAALALAAAPAAQAAPRPAGVADKPDVVLPGSPGAARIAANSAPGTWVVGGTPGAATAAIAREYGAEPILPAGGIYSIATSRARVLAAALQRAGLLRLAEPDARVQQRSHPADPLTQFQWWIPAIHPSGPAPPPVRSNSPVLGILESDVDFTNPEFRPGSGARMNAPNVPPSGLADAHGTAVSGSAGAPANGVGIVGTWPGMRMRLFPYGAEPTCSTSVRALNRAVAAGVKVVNMSYGIPMPQCEAHRVATQFAHGNDVTLVASGGNEFEEGNQASRPAVDPHVITVAAVDEDLDSAAFSNENKAIDISAPGVDVLTSVPLRFDTDGIPDGYALQDGTSFSSPIVAGAAAWVRDRRPGLSSDQVQTVFQNSARDLGDRGWEQRFGYGMLDIGRALRVRTPPNDPLEPNDDMEWIDGRRFRPDAPIFRGTRRSASLSATIDQLEDPADVYRVVFPPRSTLSFTIRSRVGDADLEVYRGSRNLTIYSTRGRLGESLNTTPIDRLVITNTARSSRSGFVDVYVAQADEIAHKARYGLSISRVGYRPSRRAGLVRTG